TPEQRNSTASIGLLYESQWRNEDSARSFGHVYEEQLPRKYSGLLRRQKDEADDTERVYSSSEGDVLLCVSGVNVFISEGFPLPLARKLRDSIVAAQGQGPLQIASATGKPRRDSGYDPGHDPGVDLVHSISSAGLMRAGMAV